MSHILKGLFFISILISSTLTVPLTFAQNNISYVSPLKQFKDGTISVSDVKCKTGFDLIIKISDDSPACVKPLTAQKLAERGWGVLKEQMVWLEFAPIQCQETPWDKYWHKLHGNETTVASALSELGVIKEYFKVQGITVFDAKRVWLNTGIPLPSCGSPLDAPFYFLVSQSDTDKMVNLGFKLIKNSPPSSATWVG